MKNYEEMSNDVFNRIDEYEKEKKMKRARMTKIAAAVTPVCAAAVVGVGLWKGGVLTPDNNPITSNDAETIVTDTEQAVTEKSSTVADTGRVTTGKISGTTASVTVQDNTENSVVDNKVVTEVSQNDSAETTEAVIVETEPVTEKTEPTESASNQPYYDTSTPTTNVPNNNGQCDIIEENVLEKKYSYNVSDGAYSTYIGGKVIAEDKIGGMLNSVKVNAGWKNGKGEWISTEILNGEIYSINGISADVAVALKFIDKGEAVTTTHYYVIMNPNADLTSVNDYIVAPVVPNTPGEETAMEQVVESTTFISGNDFCNILEVVEVDNVRYVQGYADMSYTPDVCLGSPTEYNGPYTSRLDDIPSLLYTTKEDKDVLIIKLENGGVVHLFKERR